MTIYDLPDVPMVSKAWRLQANTARFESPISSRVQTIAHPGSRWVGQMQFQSLNQARKALLSAFINRLEGSNGRFYAGPVPGHVLQGAGGGTPKVKGADQTGCTLETDGWPNSTTVLKAGDYFSFDTSDGRELKQVVEDATTNESGEVTISFVPHIRTSPADNADLEIDNPTCVMMLRDDNQGDVVTQANLLSTASFSLIEAY